MYLEEEIMKNKQLTDEFERLCEQYCRAESIFAKMPIPYALKLTPPEGMQTQAPYLTISVGVHGNEQESVQALNTILKEEERALLHLKESVLFILGNPRAVEENVRYIDTDLNRQFFAEREKIQTETYEGKRAAKILSCAKGTRYLLDIHSTDGPTRKPYGIFPERPDMIAFLQDLGTDISDVLLIPRTDTAKGFALDEHFYYTEKDCSAITIEVGHIGQGTSAIERAKKAIYGALYKTGVIAGAVAPGPNLNHWVEVQNVKKGKGITLVKGLENFQEVTPESILAYDDMSPIKSTHHGIIFFPNYTRKETDYLVRIAAERKQLM